MIWQIQASLLASLGAGGRGGPGGPGDAEIAELLSYDDNVFDLAALAAVPPPALPLPDEPGVAFWEARVREARQRGAAAVLREHLPQLHFPIAAGMSGSAAYRAATRQGVPAASLPEATGLQLRHPERIEIELHASAAGRIPVVIVREREDFVALARALAKRNEPRPVPDAQGAVAVSGYTNWSRVRAHRLRWESAEGTSRETATWGEELERLRGRQELYQDRLILLSDGPYSGVQAAAMELPSSAWRELSLAIRRDHECAHVFTKRLLGSMRNRLLDELIADYAGIVAAAGRFRADWLLRFLGLEDLPRIRAGGRLELYRGTPPLSDEAFRLLAAVAGAAAANLERFDAAELGARPRSRLGMALVLAAIASHRAVDLAAPDGAESLARAYRALQDRYGDGAAG
ncbi:MAG TPA: hypothetical protein VOA80_08680 [Thermoanaerobaculia bacterium]|nr:hypothetical protein [Thermoanaerobaculia bacterium]